MKNRLQSEDKSSACVALGLAFGSSAGTVIGSIIGVLTDALAISISLSISMCSMIGLMAGLIWSSLHTGETPAAACRVDNGTQPKAVRTGKGRK